MIAIPEGWDKAKLNCMDVEGSKRSLIAGGGNARSETMLRTSRNEADNAAYYDDDGRPITMLSDDQSIENATQARGERYGRVRRSNRVAPEDQSDENYAYTDRDGSDLGRRTRARTKHGTYVDEQDSASGAFKMGRKNRVKPKKTEILYIRSPLHAMHSDRSISETAMRMDEMSASVSSAEVGGRVAAKKGATRNRRQVSFKTDSADGGRHAATDGSIASGFSGQEEVFGDKLQRYRSVSNITLSSNHQQAELAPVDTRRPSLLVTTPSDPMTASPPHTREIIAGTAAPPPPVQRHASLPGSVDEEYDMSELQRDHTEPKAIYGENVQTTNIDDDRGGPTPDIPPPDYDGSDAYVSPAPAEQITTTPVTPAALPAPDKNAEKSDSDSGIGHRDSMRPVSELNLKNSKLMEKKSIFTQAYDGVQTSRLKSAESGADSM